MKVLVTGTAGFIGSAVAMKLLDRGDSVIGIDNHNPYYDPELKQARVDRFINKTNYQHLRIDLVDRAAIHITEALALGRKAKINLLPLQHG